MGYFLSKIGFKEAIGDALMVFPHVTSVPFLLGGLTKCGAEVERVSYKILSLLSECFNNLGFACHQYVLQYKEYLIKRLLLNR